MAKKDILKSGLIKKKPIITEKNAQKVVEKIHQQPKEENTIKTSVDIRKTLYKAMKRKLLDDEITMRQYLEKLIEADLNS